jgi:hypothetical protein
LAEANINRAVGSNSVVAVKHATIPFNAVVVSEFLSDKKSAQIVTTNRGLFLLGWESGGTVSLFHLIPAPAEFSSGNEEAKVAINSSSSFPAEGQTSRR